MATYYSEQFQPTQVGAVTTLPTGHRAAAAFKGNLQAQIATFKNVTLATGDVVKFFKVRSSDVYLRLSIVHASGGTDIPGTLGLQKEDGTVVDADFFLADVDFETARTIVLNGTVDGGWQITPNVPAVADTTNLFGIPIWQSLALTADPMLTYDVVLVVGTVNSGNAMSLTAILEYMTQA